jgi:hypothetical protein
MRLGRLRLLAEAFLILSSPGEGLTFAEIGQRFAKAND